MKRMTNKTQPAMSDWRRGGLPGTVKITPLHTILVQPTLLPSTLQKMLITIKHAFWSRKASFFWILAWPCANVAHLCHCTGSSLPFAKGKANNISKVSYSSGHLETQSCRMKSNQLGCTTHHPILVPLSSLLWLFPNIWPPETALRGCW